MGFRDALTAFRIEDPAFTGSVESNAIKNLRSLTLSKPEAGTLHSRVICEHIESHFAGHAANLPVAHGPVTGYVWHDEMAGKLRLSMIQGTPGDLPFCADVETTERLDEVVTEYLDSPYLEGIPFSELTAVATGDWYEASEHGKSEEGRAPLRVWAIRVQ